MVLEPLKAIHPRSPSSCQAFQCLWKAYSGVLLPAFNPASAVLTRDGTKLRFRMRKFGTFSEVWIRIRFALFFDLRIRFEFQKRPSLVLTLELRKGAMS